MPTNRECEIGLAHAPDPDATKYVTLWRLLSSIVEGRLLGGRVTGTSEQTYTIGPYNQIDEDRDVDLGKTNIVRVWRGGQFDTVIMRLEGKGFCYLKDGSMWEGYFIHEGYPPPEEELRVRIEPEERIP